MRSCAISQGVDDTLLAISQKPNPREVSQDDILGISLTSFLLSPDNPKYQS
ncbi:MAG: hypothetical protein V7K14_10290 [Nostoc sp.]|uniref:hypothetical protein n=1 Tax=unclassified Nostoc TaxID=2593658 RepID=UPI0025D4ACF6|nr:hypothetical protein [Nostoc sp. NMS7]MBN3946153.1 hypothetical protein [Nostoc sp. NMS7]